MSWGERSCTAFGKCRRNPTYETCNVDCPGYISNGREPDSSSKKQLETLKQASKKKTIPAWRVARMLKRTRH